MISFQVLDGGSFGNSSLYLIGKNLIIKLTKTQAGKSKKAREFELACFFLCRMAYPQIGGDGLPAFDVVDIVKITVRPWASYGYFGGMQLHWLIVLI